MNSDKVIVTLDSFEQGLMINGLLEFKNKIIERGQPPEDVEDLILKLIDAPKAKVKRHSREAR